MHLLQFIIQLSWRIESTILGSFLHFIQYHMSSAIGDSCYQLSDITIVQAGKNRHIWPALISYTKISDRQINWRLVDSRKGGIECFLRAGRVSSSLPTAGCS